MLLGEVKGFPRMVQKSNDMTQKKTEGLRWPFGSAQVLAVRGAAYPLGRLPQLA